MVDIIPLDNLGEGQSGRIVELVGPAAWKHRLEELGLRDGAIVSLIKRGEPCIIGIRSQRLSFRCDPDMMVLVEPVLSASSVGLAP
ncbi:FeoA family protein [Planctomicrobium piriforme]|uniref:FeoA family protein n=1 Tax=Planctomicrobium piriforme TaxID=1576369 RepID=UPI0015874E7F|nr:FeoA domain-containing protein [Planctomicrobium piriforme]